MHSASSSVGFRIQAPALYVRDTGTIKGMGVFAMRSFERGEIIELAPVFLLPEALEALPLELQRRVYEWSELAGDVRAPFRALAFGYGSLYNHSTAANVTFTPDEELQVMVYRAARHIASDEELTINYNAATSDPDSADFHWFRYFGIEEIPGL